MNEWQIEYWCWLVPGPHCPPDRPSNRRSACLPEAWAEQISLTNRSYWWLQTDVDSQRQPVRLTGPADRDGQSEAWVADQGTELNLRSSLAQEANQELIAWAVPGVPSPDAAHLISHRSGQFHLLLDRPDCGNATAQPVADALLRWSVALRRVRSWTAIRNHSESEGRPLRRYLVTEEDVRGEAPVECLLWPGIALVRFTRPMGDRERSLEAWPVPDLLEEVLDALLLAGTAPVSRRLVAGDDDCDYLATLPVVQVRRRSGGGSGTEDGDGRTAEPPVHAWLDPAWSALREEMCRWVLDEAGDSGAVRVPLEDWPPLLRFARVAGLPGIRELVLESGLGIHSLDVTGTRLALAPCGGAHGACLPRYRQAILFDAVLDGEPDVDSPPKSVFDFLANWKGILAAQQRKALWKELEGRGRWRSIWRDDFAPPPLPVSFRTIDVGSFQGSGPVKPPGRDARLEQWREWLETIPPGSRRGGWFTVLRWLAWICRQRGESSEPPAWEARLTGLLNRHVHGHAGDRWTFCHDAFVGDLAYRLWGPALWLLSGDAWRRRDPLRSDDGESGSPPAPWLGTIVYALLSFFSGRCDLESGTAGEKEHFDWIADGKDARFYFGLALDETEWIEIAGAGLGVTLPAEPQRAVVARLLLPPARIAARGFRLGQSRLGHPCDPLADR